MNALLAAEANPLLRPSALRLDLREFGIEVAGSVSLVGFANGDVCIGALVVGVAPGSSLELRPYIDPGREGAGVETVEIA